MPDLWIPGATRLDIGDHAPTDGGPPKAIAHITWDVNATAAAPADLVPYERLVDWFGRNPAGKPSAPTALWDPFTGRITQFLPANSRSKSLVDGPGGTRTNRAGDVVIQFEALFFPYCRVNGKVYPRLIDTPCLGWPTINAWTRSWGVPDRWPMGRPVDFTSRRSEEIWESQAGWYAHAQAPENSHQDPGSWPAFTTEQEDDMTPEERKLLTDMTAAVKRIEASMAIKPWTYKGQGETRDAYGYLRDIERAVKGLGATGLTPEQSDALAKKVADLLAARLQA